MTDLHNLPDYTHYTYRVLWSPEDDEFVGLHPHPPSGGVRDQLTTDETTWALLPGSRVIGDSPPSLSRLAPTQDEALHGIRKLALEVIKDMAVNGEVIPCPLGRPRR